MVSTCSSGCIVSQALAGGKSATASLPFSALRDRKVRTEKGVLPRSGVILSTSGKGGVQLTLLKVLSRMRYSPPHSTEGKGMGSPQPPSPEYEVYTSTLCAMAWDHQAKAGQAPPIEATSTCLARKGHRQG